MTNNTKHSYKRVLPHSLKLSLGLGMGLWIVTANGLNSPVEPSTHDSFPYSEISSEPQHIYGENAAELKDQRILFRQAEQALRKHHYRTFDRLTAKLQDYPLLPYLQYRKMRRQIGKLERETIDEFFASNEPSQITSRLRQSLLKYYARKQRWDDFLHFYEPQTSTTLRCHHLTALIKTGQQDLAMTLVEPIWLSARSQPKACNKAFQAWEKAGHRTHELTWQRIELAMSRGRTHLAKHLAKSLNNIDRKWVELWIGAHRNPHIVTGHSRLKAEHPMASRIMIHAIKRQARKDLDKAVRLWHTLDLKHHFTQAEQYAVYRHIGLTMARRHHADAEHWLIKIPSEYADSQVAEWLIRTSIRHADWQQTIETIESLAAKEQSNLRWQFWWAYANEQLGNRLDAEGIYHYLANRRSYYGFLAADQLELPYAFENRPLEIDDHELAVLSHYPEAIRAKEFYEVNKITDARREWRQLALRLSQQEKLTASKLAQYWGWHDRAIVTMGKTKYRDDIELRFPLPLKEKVAKYSQNNKIDPALTYAIIRRESAFMADARSSQGALGLMQIRPRTARSVARSMKVRYRGKRSLLQEDTNLNLGTGYLSKMLKRHNLQPVLATAAYNAGPHRVKKWLPEDQEMDAIRWIETIPFTETREYVSNVLAYTTIYQHLMENSYTRLSNRMPPVQPKNPPHRTAQVTAQATTDNLKI